MALTSKGGVFGPYYDPDHLNYYGGMEIVKDGDSIPQAIKVKFNASNQPLNTQKQKFLDELERLGWDNRSFGAFVQFEYNEPEDILSLTIDLDAPDDLVYQLLSLFCFYLTDGDYNVEEGGVFLYIMYIALTWWGKEGNTQLEGKVNGIPYKLSPASSGNFSSIANEPGYTGDFNHMYMKFRYNKIAQEVVSSQTATLTITTDTEGMVSLVGVAGEFEGAGSFNMVRVTGGANIPSGDYSILGISDDNNTCWIDPDGATITDGSASVDFSIVVHDDFLTEDYHNHLFAAGLREVHEVLLEESEFIETDLDTTESDVYTVKIHIQGVMDRLDKFYALPELMENMRNKVVQSLHTMAGFIHDDSALQA